MAGNKGGGSKPGSRPNNGGARPGTGPKITNVVKAVERDLRALERHIALIQGIGYKEIEELRAWVDRLHEQLEIKLVEAPDYSQNEEPAEDWDGKEVL